VFGNDTHFFVAINYILQTRIGKFSYTVINDAITTRARIYAQYTIAAVRDVAARHRQGLLYYITTYKALELMRHGLVWH